MSQRRPRDGVSKGAMLVFLISLLVSIGIMSASLVRIQNADSISAASSRQLLVPAITVAVEEGQLSDATGGQHSDVFSGPSASGDESPRSVRTPIAVQRQQRSAHASDFAREALDSILVADQHGNSLSGPLCVVVVAGNNRLALSAAETWADESTLFVTTSRNLYTELIHSGRGNHSSSVVLLNTDRFAKWRYHLLHASRYSAASNERSNPAWLPTFLWLVKSGNRHEKVSALTQSCEWLHFTSPSVFIRQALYVGQLQNLPADDAPRAVAMTEYLKGYRVLPQAGIPPRALAIFKLWCGFSLNRALLQKVDSRICVRSVGSQVSLAWDDEIGVSSCIAAVGRVPITSPRGTVAAETDRGVIDAALSDGSSERSPLQCIRCASIVAPVDNDKIMRSIASLPRNGGHDDVSWCAPRRALCELKLLSSQAPFVGHQWLRWMRNLTNHNNRGNEQVVL